MEKLINSKFLLQNQYAEQLQVLTQNLQQQEQNIDWDNLYQTDPAEYVKLKAESDRKKETLNLAQQEQILFGFYIYAILQRPFLHIF